MKKGITFGEVLFRLSTKEYLRFSQATNFNADYGGRELNVANFLVKFGMDAEFVLMKFLMNWESIVLSNVRI